MNNDETIIISRSAQLTPLEHAKELALYIEHASCAVSILGDLLAAAPEENFSDGAMQSIGFLMNILSDGMLQRSIDGYGCIERHKQAASGAPV